MIETGLIALFFGALAGAPAQSLDRMFSEWSILRISVISAVPALALILVASIVLYARAATTPSSECGVDACAMAAVASMAIGMFAVLGIAVGALASVIVLSMARSK